MGMCLRYQTEAWKIWFQFLDLSKTLCAISDKLLNLLGISSSAIKWRIISSCLEE